MSEYKFQVEALMKNANVLSFNEICDTLPLLPASQILGDLQNCAHLVQVMYYVSYGSLHILYIKCTYYVSSQYLFLNLYPSLRGVQAFRF